jgi:hypothetical protein
MEKGIIAWNGDRMNLLQIVFEVNDNSSCLNADIYCINAIAWEKTNACRISVGKSERKKETIKKTQT